MKRFTNSQMIELVFLKFETKGCITNTFSMCELPKGHTEKLSPVSKIFGFIITLISFYIILKDMIRSKFHQMGENHFAMILILVFTLSNRNLISNHCSTEIVNNADISRVSKNSC